MSDSELCLLCYGSAGPCCDCESSEFSWSQSPSQGSYGSKSPSPDEPSLYTIDGSYFIMGPLNNPDLEIDVQRLQPGLEDPHAATTPENYSDTETWDSPSTVAPPESSSPGSIDVGSELLSMGAALTLPSYRQENYLWNVDQPLPCCACNCGCSLVNAPPLNGRVDSNATILFTTASMGFPPTPVLETEQPPRDVGGGLQAQRHPVDTFEDSFSDATQGSLDDHLCTINARPVAAEAHDICAVTRPAAIEKNSEIDHTSAPRPTTYKKALPSDPTTLDLTISTELEPSMSQGATNDGPCDALDSETRRDDYVPSKVVSDRPSILTLYSNETKTREHMKRRHSVVESCSQELKKAKLSISCLRTMVTLAKVDDSRTSKPSEEIGYQATEPASMRRARSLRDGLEGSLFSSSLRAPTFGLCADKDFPPTVPSTPLPNSVDYARSRTNPMVRTIASHHCRSLNIPAIPPVPIIAPPLGVPPMVVHCPEDHAINRIKALLLRERSERKRDGLDVHDRKRKQRFQAIYEVLPHRDSASINSSEGWNQWEEESTCSAIESQESQTISASVKLFHIQDKKNWSNSFSIVDDFRKEIVEWILKTLPRESREEAPRDKRPHGVDLYDQLTGSYQTRFHAAQLFHRYFVLPEYWREVYKRKEPKEPCEKIWDLAVACIALSVKLHRDCLRPLYPVFAVEFLALAPHSMTQATLQRAQCDILYRFRFRLGSCTPQDVLDELWNALPTLRMAAAPISWAVVESATWNTLFKSLFEADMLQYPVTLLTAAALLESLSLALVCHFRREARANAKVCKCKPPARATVSESELDDIEPTSWQIYSFEAGQLVDDVVLDVKDVLDLSDMELDACRKWLSNVGKE